MNALYEWQNVARGNQPALIQEFLDGIEPIASPCMYLDARDTEIDVEQARDRYEAWEANARKKTEHKSGFLTWLLYILIPLVVAGFLMFWRRKFREA